MGKPISIDQNGDGVATTPDARSTTCLTLSPRTHESMTIWRNVLATLSAGLLLCCGNATSAADGDASFARQVQPILARKCFPCHGPDKSEGGLRLHKRETAFGTTDSGETAIVPGKPDASELIKRITSDDESLRMPSKGKPLPAEEIALIRDWIAQGAKWQSHWAFEPVQPQTPPAVKHKHWVRNEIDAFILAKLEEHELSPSPPARAEAILRRIYFDLTGLPPTPAEFDAFLKECAADPDEAYERVVDRLLDSPRYGERWARHWLDVVRFAETNSFERDGIKPHAWRYRDYVIRSLNDDKPYDQFIREQLAGDELPEPTADSIIATGFYRLGLWDDEPADPLLAKYDGLDDIVTTTSQAFLALTVNCARCHDHKIDPIPQRDYYSLVAFFHNITPNGYENPNVVRPIFPNAGDRERYESAQKQQRQRQNDVQAKITEIENEFRRKRKEATDAQHADLDDLEYRFYRDSWEKLPDFDELKAETVAKLERPYFDLRPATRPTFFGFVFSGVLKVPADGEYTFTIDSDDGARLSIDGKEILNYDGVHTLGTPKTAKVSLNRGRLSVRLDYFQFRGEKGLSVTWSGPGFKARSLSATAADGTELAAAKNTAERIKIKGADVLGADRVAEYKALERELDELKKAKPWDQFALCVTEHGASARDTFVLQRGNAHSPGAKVGPKYLDVLGGGEAAVLPRPASATTSGRRLELANWIASPENRMTSRVIVNRLWQHHFGRGLVRSPNNFGQLGEPPTHGELLDFLAADFVRGGWKLKRMHKLMVMSNTYRQAAESSSIAGPQSPKPPPDPKSEIRNPKSPPTSQSLVPNPSTPSSLDPANNYFWRFNMRRLSAEEIRDAVLAVNGRLNLEMYGPGIYPEISAEVLAGQSKPGDGWKKSSYEEQARRSVYIHVKRSLILPMLSNFDFPETDVSCEARFVTTQPGQALSMLNGDFLNQQAVEFAARLRREAGDAVKAQIALALRLALCRTPSDKEIERGVKLIEMLQKKHGQSASAAMNNYCLMVLNLNEFVYVD